MGTDCVLKDRKGQAQEMVPSPAYPTIPHPPGSAGDVLVTVPGFRDRAGCHLFCVHGPQMECDTSPGHCITISPTELGEPTVRAQAGVRMEPEWGPSLAVPPAVGKARPRGLSFFTHAVSSWTTYHKTPDPLVFHQSRDLTLSNELCMWPVTTTFE